MMLVITGRRMTRIIWDYILFAKPSFGSAPNSVLFANSVRRVVELLGEYLMLDARLKHLGAGNILQFLLVTVLIDILMYGRHAVMITESKRL